MNVQAHMSGQLSGQVPNQGTMPHNNDNSLMQNFVGGTGVGTSRNITGSMDDRILNLRQSMRTAVFTLLHKRKPCPADAASKAKYVEYARRLEDGLFKMAIKKASQNNPVCLNEKYLDDYSNLSTLESRISNLIKGKYPNHNNQRPANSSTVGTMIPTPGLLNNPTLKVASSTNATIVGNNITPVNTGNLLTSGGVLGGNMSNGSQLSLRNFSIGPGGNMASKGSQRSTGHMIPTPGFINSAANNKSGGCSAEPTMVPQSQQQKQRQHTSCQNSHLFSSQMAAGLRPNMQPKRSGVATSSVNDVVGGSEKSVEQGIDNFSQSGIQGEGSKTNPDPFRSGNFYGAITSVGTMTNLQNINTASFQSVSRVNSSLSHHQQQTQQQPNLFQQNPNQIHQQQQHHFHHQRILKQQTLQQHRLISNGGLGKGQVATDMITNVKHEHGMENHSQAMHSQASERFQFSQFQNQYQNSEEDCHSDAQLLSITSKTDICTSLPQNSQQSQQVLHPQNVGSDSINSFNNLAVGVKSESKPRGVSHSQCQENTRMSDRMSSEKHIQEAFHQRISGMDEAQPINLTEGSVSGQHHTYASESHNLQNSIGTTCRYGNTSHNPKLQNQQRWLLFLRHAWYCKPAGGKCQDRNCATVQKLLSHMEGCFESQCFYHRCRATKALVSHYRNCKDPQCATCVPVKTYHQQQAKTRAQARLKSESSTVSSVNRPVVPIHSLSATGRAVFGSPRRAGTLDHFQPSLKRLKVEHSFQPVLSESESCKSYTVPITEVDLSQEAEKRDHKHSDAHAPLKSGTLEVKAEIPDVSVQAGFAIKEMINEAVEDVPKPSPTKAMVSHCKNCKESRCPVCVPFKIYHQQQAKTRGQACLTSESSTVSSVNRVVVPIHSLRATGGAVSGTPRRDGTLDNLQPSVKRLKVEHSFQPVLSETERCKSYAVPTTEVDLSQETERQDHRRSDAHAPLKSGTLEVKAEIPDISVQAGFGIKEMINEAVEDVPKPRLFSEPGKHDLSGDSPKQENIKIDKDPEPLKKEDLVESSELASKSGKSKIKGVSLIEFFTPELVREHICGLRQWVGQSKAKAEKYQAMKNSMSENSCQLCAVEKLAFEPPPIYCTPCGARIKRNATYYTVVGGEARHSFCTPCYTESRGDNVLIEGTSIPKARLKKKKNDEVTEEAWVQCDKCEAWQHQICALFNGRRNDCGQAEYTCPNCYLIEVEQNERKPLLQSAVLGAKDLPRMILSDHIEQRLFKRLKQERMERAKLQGKSFDEIPTAESLVVRVVSSVDKKLEVKSRFLEIVGEDNFPKEFPYKSKVILLFQKIEGVEVCLFGMYVQEFGTECSLPNQRRVYLSYLDSVKYFRPDIKSANGEALRTFVYHEIIIGYLEYCKLRGFTSCYIWACPPLKGEDYILYCHPEIQKTPKSDKLREWYLAMLSKAAKQGIVAETTNLYDHFFTQTGECRAKVTAARLPYFDGDYWPGAAEDIIYQMSQEDNGRKGNKKRIFKKTITKRDLKATDQSDLSENASKDLPLMHKLGETIRPMKEDFIMVHLQHCCTHCCTLMVTGNRWICSQCKDFKLCDGCYEAEQKRKYKERHPVNHKEKHNLFPVKIADIPADTKDRDEILESEFFDTRHAFLSLCQGNHYQYDTLRRAKHSSMMMLYHLHNPTAPAFVSTCNACQLDIESGQGWRCEVCLDYDLCNACYSKEGRINHPHKLTNHPSLVDQNAQNKEARQLRVLQLRKMLDLLVHASLCSSLECQYPDCRKVKGLFRHAKRCKVHASEGCALCKKMWYLLHIHARACKEPKCRIPRCRDIKESVRRLQQQSESRRRAAVMEMMRQRAAEIVGTSG